MGDILVVCEFRAFFFPEDLSGLPPIRQVKIRIEWILGAMPMVKASC